MLRIGLVGAGWHATADHAPALRHCAASDEFRGRVELSGVFDIDQAKAADVAAHFGFRRAYDSLGAMLADVDAVLSIVPPAAMPAALETIVQHSRPVLIEKPLGRDLAEARTIAAKLDGHPHMVSLNRRFDPAVAIARRWMAQRSPASRLFAIIKRRERRESDFVWSTGIHATDLLCNLLGPLSFVRPDNKGSSVGARVTNARQLRGTIVFAPLARKVKEAILIGDVPENWAVRIDTGTHDPWRVRCSRAGAIEIEQTADPATPSFVCNGTVDETAAFLRGVLAGDLRGPTIADAMPGTELAHAIQSNARPSSGE